MPNVNLLMLLFGFLVLAATAEAQDTKKAANRPSVSGVYPHLTMWNDENECGTGAVVLWGGDLWVITYAPHKPNGSSDRLYQITPQREQLVRPESIGGTPANRMIHMETNQLLIGPYVIDAAKNVRVLPSTQLYGRLTGNARHLTEPDSKAYYATMEEGLYEVDLKTLEVKCLIRDGNRGAPEIGLKSELPGYHGKGLYSGQGRLLYSNNGEQSTEAKRNPTTPSGALAQWFQEGDWQLVRRNQFTELTGPGGIYGNRKATDPVWAMGWDAKSLLLALLEEKQWHFYRLPKGSHSYDGAHGWNTEWPRIRDIGEEDLLATMHGTFWRFPKTFSRNRSAGISPRSNYLKVIGDFCRWNDQIVFGCDDSARAEFLNKREFKSEQGAPKQSNSNLWFVDSETLDRLGPAIGRGNVWLQEDLKAGVCSDPYLFDGYDYRQLSLSHGSAVPVEFVLEVDQAGDNTWKQVGRLTVPPNQSIFKMFEDDNRGAWIRIQALGDARSVTANFQYRNRDSRSEVNAPMFAGIAKANVKAESFGLMRSLSYDRLGVVAASGSDGSEAALYELGQDMRLVPVNDDDAARELVAAVAQPRGPITVDRASVIIEEDGKRYRLPKNGDVERVGDPARWSIGELIQPRLRENLAIGGVCRSSSIHRDFVAENAIDGKLDEQSRWVSSQHQKGWLEVVWDEPKTVNSCLVVSGWKRDPKTVAINFDLKIKQGGDWISLPGGRVRENRKIAKEVVLDKPMAIEGIRLEAMDTGYVRIYELAVFERELGLDAIKGSSRFGVPRLCREVATERDLLNVHGTFYELPARNAQGLAKMRPIATHDLAVHDFCSHGGLLYFTGLDATTNSEHIFRSQDGRAAVWAGVVDDLWKLGKPRGVGGPWRESSVKANQPSDPYLMTAYDQKSVAMRSTRLTTLRLEVDVDGTGVWVKYRDFEVGPDKPVAHRFPEGFSAYWVRAVSEQDTKATVIFDYR